MLIPLNFGSESGTKATTASNSFLNIQGRFFFSQSILITIYNDESIWVEVEIAYSTI